jgi:two-component system response regulator YesN
MKKYRLLLVEDEDIIRQGLMHMITKMDLNIDVVQASDGVEAIELCAANDIDILLTDISMPRMDGLSLIS